jgi:hypothetical protein
VSINMDKREVMNRPWIEDGSLENDASSNE